jgi:tetratricopeptide (TPR) repeat protein
MSATAQQLRQWTDEVAADPGSPAFRPLAEHYRAAGRGDAALRLVLRYLERNPHDVEGHYLLGLLYRDTGEEVKAFDEWDMALALSPEHLGARRQIGLLCLERGDHAAAVRHLEHARSLDIEDEEVRQALEVAWVRAHGGEPAPPPLAADAHERSLDGASASDPGPAPTTPPTTPPAAADAAPASSQFDAVQGEFHALSRERGMVGAVMLDAQGFVVAGEMHVGERDRGPEIAAVLSGASAEAERAVAYLKMGTWKGILVETPDAVIRLSPTRGGGMVAVAGRRDVPMGWVLRLAARAQAAAGRFLDALEER